MPTKNLVSTAGLMSRVSRQTGVTTPYMKNVLMGFILLLDKQKVMLFCLFQINHLKKELKNTVIAW